MIDINAQITEIPAMSKFAEKGIRFDFKPYEKLIPKLSMLAAIPINNMANHCMLITSCDC